MGMLSFKWHKKNTEPVRKGIKIMFFQDYLKEANNEITKKLKKWDCFDFNYPTKFLKNLYWLLEERNLTYRDPGFGEYDGKTTVVVGTLTADFKDHERRR